MPKTPNYTEEMTIEMKRRYISVAGESEEVRDAMVAELAQEFKKSERSIRAKLSRENVYKRKTPVAKDGAPAIKKDALAYTLALQAGVPLTSAEKLTKVDLKALISVIVDLREQVEDLQSDLDAVTH